MNIAHKVPEINPIDRMKILQELSQITNCPIHTLMTDLGIEGYRCPTIRKAISQYHAAKKLNDNDGMNAARTEWSRLSLEAVAKATAIEEIKRIFISTPETDAKEAALVKWNEISLQKLKEVSTIEEIVEVYNNAPYGGPTQHEAYLKWDEYALQQSDEARTIEEIKKAYGDAPSESASQQKTLGKWSTYCDDIQKLREVYDASLNGHCEPEILKLLNEMAEKEIGESTSVHFAQRVYNLLPEKSTGPRKIAVQKMCDLHSEFRKRESQARK